MAFYDLQSIDLDVDLDTAFRFIADPGRLPEWTNAFAEVDGGRALMRTPMGEARVELEVDARRETGTIDWRMRFEDGSRETAYSRLIAAGPQRSVFAFVLMPSAAALEAIEGALEQQSATLARELVELKRTLEA